MDKQLKIAVFIDFDNIEIGVKSTLQREFDVAAVLEALKERGEIVTKIAYANWGRQDTHTRALSEHAVQMVQRDPSPRGDKNGADINLALDALEMAFTHDHINAFAIVSGDSDFIALVNKLKQYDKTVFVVGGRAFTSTILQKNCHEFVSYESLMDEQPRSSVSSAQQQLPLQAALPAGEKPAFVPREHSRPHYDKGHGGGFQRGGSGGGGQQRGRPPALDLGQAMPLVERALQVLERREVRPQLGLLKSTMLQLDSSFSERAYGASSFTDFVEKLRKADYVAVTGGEGRYMIQRKHSGVTEKTVKPEGALPVLRDVLENHRLEMEDGCPSDDLLGWVKEEQPNFDWKTFGFQEFSEMLNFAQDKGVVRIQPDEERGLLVYLGAEFHPPAVAEPVIPVAIAEPEEERQPVVKGQPTAREPRVKRTTRKTVARTPSLATEGDAADDNVGNVGNAVETPEPKKATRKMPTKRAGTRRIVKTAPAPQPEAPAESSTEE
ncbi:MAG: hypothetical protein JWO80_4750 [Bryobacterales bacterium]|nr:hypothetical protein [Bryobacterales bacterium]